MNAHLRHFLETTGHAHLVLCPEKVTTFLFDGIITVSVITNWGPEVLGTYKVKVGGATTSFQEQFSDFRKRYEKLREAMKNTFPGRTIKVELDRGERYLKEKNIAGAMDALETIRACFDVLAKELLQRIRR